MRMRSSRRVASPPLVESVESLRYCRRRVTSLRSVSAEAIESLAIGAWILGTGGGGSPYYGLLNMRQLYRGGVVVSLLDPAALAEAAARSVGRRPRHRRRRDDRHHALHQRRRSATRAHAGRGSAHRLAVGRVVAPVRRLAGRSGRDRPRRGVHARRRPRVRWPAARPLRHARHARHRASHPSIGSQIKGFSERFMRAR